VDNNPLNRLSSVFRTEAWVQAWIDTWGKDSTIELIDLGGKKNPLECVYMEKRRIKKILPVTALHLAGIGCSSVSTPRSEYNDISGLISLFGKIEDVGKNLAPLGWQEFIVPDVIDKSGYADSLKDLSAVLNASLCVKKVEPAYHVQSEDFTDYLASLSASTRLKYFNRRERLAENGEIERKIYPLQEAKTFFKFLNEFHLQRWARPCYSDASQSFMINFLERLKPQGGKAIMESILVDGEVVSVIFDIVWAGKRYNFQSGYAENRFSKIALGAIHLGYSIESAIKNGQVYDFMAGMGKNSNYKASVANSSTMLKTVSIQRSYISFINKIYRIFK
jgi:hypothetical protein